MNKIFEVFKSKCTKQEMDNPAFLRGVIISCYSEIDSLKKENEQLRNKKGIWLSPEKVADMRKELDSFLTD